MARRYITQPIAWEGLGEWERDSVLSSDLTVHVPDERPVPTGLLDPRGHKLYAINESDPVGFVRVRT